MKKIQIIICSFIGIALVIFTLYVVGVIHIPSSSNSQSTFEKYAQSVLSSDYEIYTYGSNVDTYYNIEVTKVKNIDSINFISKNKFLIINDIKSSLSILSIEKISKYIDEGVCVIYIGSNLLDDIRQMFQLDSIDFENFGVSLFKKSNQIKANIGFLTLSEKSKCEDDSKFLFNSVLIELNNFVNR